ncbi:hypothetical protein BZG36_02003 [Bifiguratus adelaidae]|uniref:Geranylgeranyl pyrophosphate synthase n=1 Tax=Bifiguratus adelaidae TaxID=1938954 RepID=A0A261Y4M8_9FUNG|nr:hypothetical protein BZG36_02003 [Bifiguratus adelaidae]
MATNRDVEKSPYGDEVAYTESTTAEDRPSSSVQDEHYPKSKMPRVDWPRIKQRVMTRDGWIGDYDFTWLCIPRIPCWRGERKKRRLPPFFGLHESLPLAVALIMGLQHALAMLSGIVTPPLILGGAGSNNLNLTADYQQYMISSSLIICGIGSAVQITRFKLWGGKYYLGTGLLSVVGTSFTIIPLAESVIANMYKTGFCPSQTASDGTVIQLPCPQGYGAILGTSAVCSLLEIFLSFVPPQKLRKVFPPMVTGTTVFLIGLSLVTSGFQGWGGGAGPCIARPASGYFSVCPNVGAPNAQPWGSPVWLGLGLSVFMTIILVELFGSTFMKNAQVVIGLVVGIIISAATGYIDHSSIASAPVATFVWTKTFPLSIYGPAVIPLLIVYVVSMVECIGDITASCDVSRVEVDGPQFDSRIQGGVLADGVNSLFSALATNTPLSTFAQNNGVIALTRCANRGAGYMTCLFLILMGIFAKFAAVFLAVPAAVIGGMTTFLFANVAVSGIRILAYMKWTRRDRFIVSAALSIGLGVNLVPNWFSYVLTYSGPNQTLRGFYDAVDVIVSTGFVIACIITIALNLILPKDFDQGEYEEDLALEAESEMAESKPRVLKERTIRPEKGHIPDLEAILSVTGMNHHHRRVSTDKPARHPTTERTQDEILLEPFYYLRGHPGKEIRTQLISAFDDWLHVPHEQLDTITKVVEMLHTASLLVDDVEDSSVLRRGVPVAHTIYGVAQTINSGNYVYFLALQELLTMGNAKFIQIFTEELLNLHRGQGMEIYWRDTLTCPTEEEFIQMVMNKTGGLLRLAVKLMQEASASDVDYVPIVDLIGILYQVRDDYFNLQSTQYHDHKGYCEDLTEGKFSFPIIHSIRSAPSNRQLLNILHQRTESVEVKKYAVQVMEGTGSFEYTRDYLARVDAKARAEVERLGGNPRLLAILQALQV